MIEREQKLAVIEKDTVGVVVERIKEFQDKKELYLPPNYSPENALKSAFLILQQTLNREKLPVLEACTRISITNSLLDMVIQGLNPAKKQCYFIPYGKQLTCMRSYFGSMALVKNICKAKDVYAEIIYIGDEFKYEIRNGNKHIQMHLQKFDNIDSKKIAGAYCTITFEDDGEITEVMNMDTIQKSWKKSKVDWHREGGVHQEFTEEMCKRTVINRACKKLINSSSDSAVLVEAVNRADEISTEAEVDDKIKRKANKEVIDITPPDKEKKKDKAKLKKDKPTQQYPSEDQSDEQRAKDREDKRQALFGAGDRKLTDREPDF